MTRAAYLRAYVPAENTNHPVFGFGDPRSIDPSTLRVGRFGLLAEPLDAAGFVTEWQGVHYVCPRNVRLRMLQGVVAFHAAYRGMGGAFVIPEPTARKAADELDEVLAETPHARSHILTSAWHVPPRWFLGFQADEKEVLEGATGLEVRYRTIVRTALQRVMRALDAVQKAGFDESISGEVGELAEWIDEFPSDGMLELDYGTAAGFFSDSDLVLDDSAELIWMAVEALEQGDFIGAQQHYVELASRWSEAMAVGHSS